MSISVNLEKLLPSLSIVSKNIFSGPFYSLEKHLFRSDPIRFLSIESLIYNHPLLSFTVKSGMDIFIGTTLEMTERNDGNIFLLS